MSNTLGSKNGALIAQRTLETLLELFPMLRQIATDFSAESAKLNQQIISRVVVPGTAKDYHVDNGYVADDRTTVDVPVTIDNFKHHTYGVNDKERSETGRSLVDEFALTSAHALGKAMMDSVFAKVTAANYPEVYDVTPENFDRDDVCEIDEDLADLNVPEAGRFMVLKSSYYKGLKLDTTVIANAGSGADTVKTGKLPEVDGFSVSRYPSLPHNGENLAGLPAAPVPGVIKTSVEPNSGLALQLREWYDMGKGKEFRTMTLQWGSSVGLTNTGECKRLIRIRNQ
jgi:hypothetical protein